MPINNLLISLYYHTYRLYEGGWDIRGASPDPVGAGPLIIKNVNLSGGRLRWIRLWESRPHHGPAEDTVKRG